MRQLIISVPSGRGATVIEAAQAQAGVNLARFEGCNSQNQPIDLVLIHVSNHRVEDLLQQLDAIADLHVTLLPAAVMALYPPAQDAAEQIKQVQHRSPIEVFLAGLQSVGSWPGFLAYAVAAAVVVWIGLLTNTIYLLVAAMLIAPFAGPAMNTAVATARGDWRLLGRSLLRYFVALATTIGVAAILTLLFTPEVPSQLLIDTSTISNVAVLLPLAAGMAGAIHLVQSEQSSLVSGAAVGILIAASLAPPAGIIGITLVLGRYDLAVGSIFLLLLQLVGINLAASLVFRRFGLTASGARYNRGKAWLFPVSLATTVLVLSGLLSWQLSNTPNLERSSQAQVANATVQSVMQTHPNLRLITADVRFTRATQGDPNILLCIVYVQQLSQAGITKTDLKTELSQRLYRQLTDTTPLVQVNMLTGPEG